MTYIPVKTDSPLMEAIRESIMGDNEHGRYSRRVLGEAALTGNDAKEAMQHLDDISKVLGVMRKMEKGYETSRLQAMLNMLEDMNMQGLSAAHMRTLKQVRDDLQGAHGRIEHAYKQLGMVAQMTKK